MHRVFSTKKILLRSRLFFSASRADLGTLKAGQREHDKRFSVIERPLAEPRGDIAVIHELIVDHSENNHVAMPRCR
jgi:hypothetical protein